MRYFEDVLTPRGMREREREAFRRGVSSLLLMEDAARAIHASLKFLLREGSRVLVICGPGNNGGDGAALGRLLRQDGYQVLLVGAGAPATDDARTMRAYYEALGGEAVDCLSTDDLQEIAAKAEAFRPDCVVDALFGTGFHGVPEGMHADLIRLVNALGAKVVLAVDIPSGMNGEDGSAAADPASGKPLCVRATDTITLGCWKTGLFRTRQPALAGRLALAPIALPADAPEAAVRLIREEAFRWIPPRACDTHKGRAGRVLMYMGSLGMAGAAAMAARAALRAGAGLVTVACPREIIPVLQTLVPNAMCVPAETLAERVPAHDVLAAGCGLGQSAETRERLAALLARETETAVLDADALNILAETPFDLPERTVITPHPAEAARLLHTSLETVLDDPLSSARALAEKYRAVALLKGYVSFVSDGQAIVVQRRGAPALAKGGSGDVLAGILAALCADPTICAEFDGSHRLLYTAALASMCLGIAGERAQARYGDRAALTGDVIDALALQ